MEKRFSPSELKEIVEALTEGLGADWELPQDVVIKYNVTHTTDVLTGKENPGGRAWILWFIDELDNL